MLKPDRTCPKCKTEGRFVHQNTAPRYAVDSYNKFKVVPMEQWQCSNCQYLEYHEEREHA